MPNLQPSQKPLVAVTQHSPPPSNPTEPHMSQASSTIRIGHPAYTGANAVKIVIGKAAAVRELRSRGVLRDAARASVNDICKHIAGYVTISDNNGCNVVEVAHWAGIAEGASFTHGYGGLEINYPGVVAA